MFCFLNAEFCIPIARLPRAGHFYSRAVEVVTHEKFEPSFHKAEHSTMSKNVISLFSGAGGDTLGLTRAGYSVVAFSEMNAAAIATHKVEFPHSTHLTSPSGDANIKNIPDSVFQPYAGNTEIVFAGFPCQGFSHAGKKRHDDARNELVHEFVRVARIVGPTWIIGENVKGLLSRKGRDPNAPPTAPLVPVIQIIQALFEKIGYKITYRVLDATTAGIPQQRKRLILVGHRGDQYPHIPWERITAPKPTIRSLLESHLEGAVEFLRPTNEARYWISTTETEPTGTPHPNLLRLIQGIRNRSTKEKESDPSGPDQIVEPDGLISFGVRKSGYHGQILDPDEPSKTIICTYGLCPRLFVGLSNGQKYWIRCMTPRELGRIQGFPAEYAWQGTTKDKINQIGNAVPPALIQRVADLLPHATFHTQPQDGTVASDSEDDEES